MPSCKLALSKRQTFLGIDPLENTSQLTNRDCQLQSVVFAEAVVRGHKSGLLSTSDYNNLCQCETLDDVKLHLVRNSLSSSCTASHNLPSDLKYEPGLMAIFIAQVNNILHFLPKQA